MRLVEVDERCGGTVGGELVTCLDEMLAQAGVVVGLAVVYNPAVLVFVRDRLCASLQIDHTQPTHAQPDSPGDVKPAIVRASVNDFVAHPLEYVPVDALGSVENAHDSTQTDQFPLSEASSAESSLS